MRRSFVLLPILLGSALALAGPSASEGDRARLLQRNRELIRTLVDSGLLLAREDDPLKRANHCNGIAEQLADEIRQAGEERDAPRVSELGRHLRELLEQGVAPNLGLARGAIPVGSADERKLEEVRDRTAKVVGLLEEQLQQPEMRPALEDVQAGRFRVDHAAKSKGKGKGPPGRTNN